MNKQTTSLSESKRKPSALLVYLALEREGRTKPMNRVKIIDYISKNFGVHIEPKTVTESASVLKALSSGENPILDFRSKGKSGYLLGSVTSPLSQEEVVRLLTCFSTISTAAAQHAFEGLRPFMSEGDAQTVARIQSRLPEKKVVQNRNSLDYFAKLRVILEAFEKQKEVVFDHRYVDRNGETFVEEKDVAIVPYNLFEKNGRFYVLGGRMGGTKDLEGNKKSCLYIAATENMHNVRLGEEAAQDLPINECMNGKDFSLPRYLSQVYFVKEGVVYYHHASDKGHLAEIYTEPAYFLTKQMYGDCVEDVKKETVKPASKTMAKRVNYTVRLHLDLPALIMWSLYFAQQAKLVLEDHNAENQFLRQIIVAHAERACQKYAFQRHDQR
jgi:hypothetical protein